MRISIKISIYYLFLVTFAFAQSFVKDHEANQLNLIKNVVVKNNCVNFHSSQNGHAFLVIKSENPLKIEKEINCSALLTTGWDGSLGYSLYGLSVHIKKPGQVRIEFQTSLPPSSPHIASKQERQKYTISLNNRLSRFSDDKSAFLKWQKDYRDSLKSKLYGKPISHRAKKYNTVSRKNHPNFDLLHVQTPAPADSFLISLLSLPKGVERPPLLVALHGHETTWGQADTSAFSYGHIDDFCAYFANRGWAVLQPPTMDHKLYDDNWTLQGQWTWIAQQALSTVTEYVNVDTENIMVCGLSTGGHLAMNLLALDDRVRAGVVGCILSTWNHYDTRMRIPPHCDCGIHSQLSPLFEQCDWAALAAPKAVMFQHGLQDAAFCPGSDAGYLDLKWNTGILPLAEYNAMFSEIKRAYKILDNKDHAITHYHNGPHSIDNQAAFEWLSNNLKR